jgi:hypothetical protein
LTALAATYRLLLRDRLLTWGATPEEVARRMPGDELLENASVVATRAITIHAPPSAVWPWLLQMGSGRGGVYTYDWIENLFGLGMHSVDRVLPEFKNVQVGDLMPARPDGSGMRVLVLEPEEVLATKSDAGDWVWIFGLYPSDRGTRLVSRNRIDTSSASLGARIANTLMESGSLVMERKMLLGIKERAERLHSGSASDRPRTRS